MNAYYNENDPKAAAWLRELIKQGHIAPGYVDERSIAEVSPDDLAGYTQCHFFAGIGGWSYALRLAGWPDDRPVWTGSCPCQPFSAAGKQQGTDDERHLWPVFFDLIRQCRPPVVFGEQVASKPGLDWLDVVSADLESEGYAIGAADLCAAGVGAPHIRQRLYFVAHADSDRRDGQQVHLRQRRPHADLPEATWRGGAGWQRVSFAYDCIGGDENEPGDECSICGLDYSTDCQCPGPTHDGYEYDERDGILYARLGNAEYEGLQGFTWNGDNRNEPGRQHQGATGSTTEAGRASHWRDADWLPCSDGKARPVEPGTFPLAYGVSARVGRLRGYGNAIVPQIAAAFIRAAA